MLIKNFKTSLYAAFFCAFFLLSCTGENSQQDSVTVSPSPRPAVEESLRVVAMNLKNYFNGNGQGSGYPTPRGAKTAAEFDQQRERIGAAIRELQPDVIAVMELENDGFNNNSAAQDFIRLANVATSSEWSAVSRDGKKVGSDHITVGLFYRSDRLRTIGSAHTLTGPEFKRSRQPLAQVLQPLSGGENILLVVNHLKSKGSCPDSGVDTNQDGQGCWNDMRTRSANKMTQWSVQLADKSNSDNILILGDLNAYRNEDPIEAIRDDGFTELMDGKDHPVYSYIYRGKRGTLDYAFSSSALLDNVDNAFIWHVNTDIAEDKDHSQPWLGFSDHDPVVVDIRLRQSITSD